MPKAEVIESGAPRHPSFRLVWKEDGKIPWEDRVEAYLHWYWQFLHKNYGAISHFHPEDIALCGDPSKGRIYGVIHSLSFFENEVQEREAKERWDDFIIAHQDDAPEEAIALICPHDKIWIWRHHIGQVILPDGVKIKPIDGNEHILRYNPYWYYAGHYADDEEIDYLKTESSALDTMGQLQEALLARSPLQTMGNLREAISNL
jgi:hypothetical protein